VGEKPDYPAIFVSDGTIMLTLWQAVDPDQAIPLDALRALHQKLLETVRVNIEFVPEPLGGSATHHMMCYIPSGIRVEFIALAD
jgi:hypothetical protein